MGTQSTWDIYMGKNNRKTKSKWGSNILITIMFLLVIIGIYRLKSKKIERPKEKNMSSEIDEIREYFKNNNPFGKPFDTLVGFGDSETINADLRCSGGCVKKFDIGSVVKFSDQSNIDLVQSPRIRFLISEVNNYLSAPYWWFNQKDQNNKPGCGYIDRHYLPLAKKSHLDKLQLCDY